MTAGEGTSASDGRMPRGGASWLYGAATAAVWLGVVLGGLALLAAYDNTPGADAAASARWPAESSLARDRSGPTLVMLAHPRCTCTRASLSELAELLARAPRRPTTYVVFIRPGAFGRGWEQTDLWDRAGRIPGVTVIRDEQGVEAQWFGAETSGQTFLYDERGRLLFSGGTTGSRGHEGDNAGRATLAALLAGRTPPVPGTAVFGCSLFGSGDRREMEMSESHDAHAH